MTVQHKDLTGTDLHEPKGVATASADQVYIADGAGSGSWASRFSGIENLNSFDMNGVIADISTASSDYYIRVARDCTLTDIYAVLSGAITGTDAVVSLYREGILLGQSLTVAVAGSGAGVKYTLNLSPTYEFTSGQILRVVSNGASTDAAALAFTAKFTV